MSDIIWTKTDEAPLFASYSLFPIVQSFLKKGGIEIEQVDISLAGRILAAFDDILDGSHEDGLKILGELTASKEANIIKLPNISATIPQLNAAISELRSLGFNIPTYPNEIKNENDKNVASRYAKVLGSAVNPVLRQGNSDRRCVRAVKEFARSNPHDIGKWSKEVKTRVAYMQKGDFYANERSIISERDDTFLVKFKGEDGTEKTLKELEILRGEVVDATFMSVKELDKFYEKAFKEAKQQGLLVSLHLKATMMKVSDPVIFAHAIEVFFKEAFLEFGEIFADLGVKAQNGLKDIFAKISSLNEPLRAKILAKFGEILDDSASLAMVDPSQGITNFHVPNDVIIDASMPAMIRNSGKMRGKDGKEEQTLAIIPDRTYATLYEACIEELKENGALDVRTIGSVSNVGLMAKKAEEYGSHDKTFIAQSDGEFIVSSKNGDEIFRFGVQKGDIFRMTQAKDDAIEAWINLALKRAKEAKEPLIFWLDAARAHDINLIKKLKRRLGEFEAANIKFEILDYAAACKKTLETIRSGKNVISVSGNVLRDYLTDLFPILELGTSSKMLSVVPLLSGGAMFETGAGGTAPMLARDMIASNHLDWDSLGEYLALIASLEHLSASRGEKKAEILSRTLNGAVAAYLKNNRSPKSGVKSPDARASHFYLALYWADELARNGAELAGKFRQMARDLSQNEAEILKELCDVQGISVDFGGYFMPDEVKAAQIMRPSKILNQIIG